MSHLSAEARRRPDIWSYVSFSRPGSRRPSQSLPLRRNDDDPFEKHARKFSSGRADGPIDPPRFARVARAMASNNAKYIKIGAAVFTILLFFYLISPSAIPKPFRSGQKATVSAAGTTKCKISYSSSKPLTQYALMIDAGSTGSRIHVYKFNNCGPTPELENEVFEQTPKREGGSGLSSYDSDAEGAAESLDVLMNVAMEHVPESYRSCTPIAVKATAGLRKLGTEKSNKILSAVRYRIQSEYPFPIISQDKGGVEVMDGKDEGVYAWITANYLLGKIGGPSKSPTAAVFDLGGGSTQIVFEPTFPGDPNGGMPETLAEGDHKYELSFGGRKFDLYQHSYLGYGLMAARESLHQVIVLATHEHSPSDNSWTTQPLINPCIAPGMSRDVEVQLPAGHALGKSLTVTMTGPDTGSPAQCRALAEYILKKDAPCQLTPCAFDGIHQPPLSKVFAKEDIYLFSYFYDRTKPLGMPESFTLNELKDLTAKVCEGESGWGSFKAVKGALSELRDRPEHCLDLNFMLALLHTGYDMPMERTVRIAKKIQNRELGWCLGASLPLLSKESGWQCKIMEISE